MRHFPLVKLSALLLFLAMAFQNCSQRISHSSSTGESVDEASSAGGGTYDGKPAPGTYVRVYPDGCPAAGKKDLIGIMQVSASQAAITSDVCVSQDYSVTFDDTRFEYGGYNPDYIGFNAAVFESQMASEASQGVVEFWCRHADANSGLDIVLKSNGLGFLYRGTGLDSSWPTIFPRQVFPVQKSSSSQSISISSQQNSLQAVVDLTSNNNGIYSGHAVLQISGQNLDLNMSCRVLNSEPAIYASGTDILALFQMEGKAGPMGNGSAISSSNSSISGILHNPDGAGATLTNGRFGTALYFDGQNDYVDLSAIAASIPSQLTVSMWLKPDPAIADDRAAFTINSSDGNVNVLKIGTGSCTGVQDRFLLSLDVGSNCFDSAANIVDGNWHHIAAVIDSGRVILYADGVEVLNQPMTNALSSSDLWSLGQDFDGGNTSDFWRGLIDEAVVWKSALPAIEIQKISAQ